MPVIMVMMMAFMIVVVVMGVGGDHASGGGAKELGEFGILLHCRRSTFTAHMAVETDNVIALGHHHMEIVTDHQDTAAMVLADRRNRFARHHLVSDRGLQGDFEHLARNQLT